MSLLDDILGAIDEVTHDEDVLDISMFKPLSFRLGTSTWDVLGKVKDPHKLKGDALARLRLVGDARGLVYTDLRVLKLHPQEFETENIPFPGSTVPYGPGTLEVLEWSEPSDYTGQRVGTCVLRVP